MQTYRQLDEKQIIQTLEELGARIAARFPASNLRELSAQLLAVAHDVGVIAGYLRRPNWKLRSIVGIATTALLMLLVVAAKLTLGASAQMTLPDIVQTIEAAVNDIVFFGIAVFFLLGIESRSKRKRALAVLHQLRSLAHIVDMHQLTKDPERLTSSPTGDVGGRRTSGADLARYLDFCSELLSLISKIAALLVQHFNDSAVLAGVDEIEALTTGLSGKIWQKITLVER